MIYPGLAEHPGHEVAARQMKRFGGIVSFRHAGGEQAALDTCARAEVFTLGESLGGVESLIEHPGRMTHLSVAGTELEVPGGPDPAQRRHRDRGRPHRGPRPCPRLTATAWSASTSARRSPRRRSWSSRRGASRPPPSTPRPSTPTCSTGTTRAWRRSWQQDARAAEAPTLACSSAGGGLRIAVVGNEELVTAEAGRRVALSSGGKVVAVLRREPGRRPGRRCPTAHPTSYS